MISVIVFSKDRPMQLHAYLESLLMFSDIAEENISVLYKKNDRIPYNRVIQSFSKVKWIEEVNFVQQIGALMQEAEDYILFGCDDVVFIDYFKITDIIPFLEKHDDVFGYSIRLGTNFSQIPQDIHNVDGSLVWDWKINLDDYWNYPWELDCTVYRKADAIELYNQYADKMYNPNYFESVIAINARKIIKRKLMACAEHKIKAICITVNRVQDTHMNDFDSSTQTDIYTLSSIYNEEDNKLDIKKIAAKKTNKIHVDATFFLLEKPSKKIHPNKKYSLWNHLIILLKNIKYLSTVNLQREHWDMARAIASKVEIELREEFWEGNKKE